MNKHSPLPWAVRTFPTRTSKVVADAEGNTVGTATRPDDAALIVRAVNERDTIINAHVILSGEVRELAAEAEKLKDLVRRMLPGVEENYAMAKSAAADVKGICDLKGVDSSTVDAVLDMWRNIIAEAKEAIGEGEQRMKEGGAE